MTEVYDPAIDLIMYLGKIPEGCWEIKSYVLPICFEVFSLTYQKCVVMQYYSLTIINTNGGGWGKL